MTDTLLGTRALARALGISPAAVTKARREGRITPAGERDGRPLYDPEQCRDVFSESHRARRRMAQARRQIEKVAGVMFPADQIAAGLALLRSGVAKEYARIPDMVLARFPGLTEAGRDFMADKMRAVLKRQNGSR